MNAVPISEYNRDQLLTLQAIHKACGRLPNVEILSLVERLGPYLEFRRQLDSYQSQYFRATCEATCFSTGLSACCGFESIITFFADHVINFLLSTPEENGRILSVLGRPNRTGRCVYLQAKGCLWRWSPISCAMFLCEDAKQTVFTRHPEAAVLWAELREWERLHYPHNLCCSTIWKRCSVVWGGLSPHVFSYQSGTVAPQGRPDLENPPILVRERRRHAVQSLTFAGRAGGTTVHRGARAERTDSERVQVIAERLPFRRKPESDFRGILDPAFAGVTDSGLWAPSQIRPTKEGDGEWAWRLGMWFWRVPAVGGGLVWQLFDRWTPVLIWEVILLFLVSLVIAKGDKSEVRGGCNKETTWTQQLI
jgi:hypothetical protein